MEKEEKVNRECKSLIVVYSHHHKNTDKIAKVIAPVLNAAIRSSKDITPADLQRYDLIGFGSGIYSSNVHESILTLADNLSSVKDKTAFIFSTCGAPAFAVEGGHVDDYATKCHTPVKEKLESKGFRVLDGFICTGWNTNSFLKFLDGINKGRPNAQDFS